MEKDSSVETNPPTAPTIAKKMRKKRLPTDTLVTPVAPTHDHATPPDTPAIVPSGAAVAAASTASATAVTAAPPPARSPGPAPQVSTAPQARVASKRGSGDNVHNGGVFSPVPVSVTEAGTASRNRKSQLPACGQSVEDMISILERHRQKKPTASVPKAAAIQDDEDELSIDENEVELDAESSSHVTSDDSNAFAEMSEEEVSANENVDVHEDAEDDAEGSEEEAAPEALPVKTPKKGKEKSAKAAASGKVQRKKAVRSAGVTKRVPIAKASRPSTAVKAGSFYDAPNAKETPKATSASRTRSTKK